MPNKALLTLMLLSMSGTLIGCSGDDHLEDLRDYTSKVKNTYQLPDNVDHKDKIDTKT